MAYLLGIDIGTSACKLALFDPNGAAVSMASESYNVYYPKAGYVEQEPEDWWLAVCKAAKQMLAQSGIAPGEIAAVGVDGQGWSAIAADDAGNVLTRNPIWMDTRSEAICAELEKRIGGDALFALSGNPIKAPYSTGKVLWYKEHLPEIYAKTTKVLQSNSFIVYRLTGVISQDISQGYAMHCFDMRKGCWDDAMCAELGIKRSLLPDIAACDEVVGRVTRQAAALTGIPEGTPVVAGGLDAACGTLGAGVISDGQTQEQGGQAGGMSICTSSYRAEPRLILSFHVVPDRWLLQGGTTGGGGIMRWFEREFAAFERAQAEQAGKSSFERLDDLAQSIPAGSEGVVFLPYMAGERSPIWDASAKGVFYGLDYAKTRGHMLRAAMEGVAYALRHNIEVAEQAGANVTTLRAMGGAANSLLWTQIKADVTRKEIEVPACDTATTLGAAMLAGVGVGIYRNFEEAVATVQVKRRHTPDASMLGVYDAGYGLYRELYESVKGLMKKYI